MVEALLGVTEPASTDGVVIDRDRVRRPDDKLHIAMDLFCYGTAFIEEDA
jgi:hypothetical protein